MKESLPTDPFDLLLARLMGLPNGGHTGLTAVQDVDFYGNATGYTVQTVRTEDGPTCFVTQGNAQGYARYILPPKVLAVIDRQRDSITTQLRRRHGKRLAAENVGLRRGFTPEMRAKALATRKANAAKKRARKAVR